MSIEYTYKVVRVDEAARCMEVVYSAVGHQTLHIGTRLPYVGETLEAVVGLFAPLAYWEEQQLQVLPPPVGASGTVAPTTSELPAQSAAPVAIVTTLV